MAAITTLTASPAAWSDTGHWTGGVVPGDGDTVIINHATTLDVNTVVGSAPATGGTAAIDVSGGGPLTINAEVELKGDLTMTGRNVIMGAGAKIILNPASGVEYRINIGTAHGQANTLTANGTSGSHCEIRKKSGAAGVARCRGQGFQRAGKGAFTYTDFIDLGSSSVDAYDFWLNVDADVLTWDNCTFQNCGQVKESVAMVGDADFRMQDVVFSSSPGTYNLSIQSTNAVTTGSRTLNRVAFDKVCNLNSTVDVLMKETRHAKNWEIASPSLATGSQYNFVYNNAASGSPLTGTLGAQGTLIVAREATSNPHFYQFNANGNASVDGLILVPMANVSGGDGLLACSPGSARAYSAKNVLMLPCPDLTAAGKIVSMLGSANFTLTFIQHCTFITNGTGETGIGFGETYAGRPDQVGDIKSCLGVTITGTQGAFIQRQGGTVQDFVAAADVDYNARYNLIAGTDTHGYNGSATNVFSTGTPGTNDISLSSNPFVAHTRTIGSWDASKGGAGTDAAGLARLQALSGATDVQDLYDYLRAGYAVTDATLNNAGHDGVTIGMGAYVAAAAVADFGIHSPYPGMYPFPRRR